MGGWLTGFDCRGRYCCAQLVAMGVQFGTRVRAPLTPRITAHMHAVDGEPFLRATFCHGFVSAIWDRLSFIM
jgi:hypothetical protein